MRCIARLSSDTGIAWGKEIVLLIRRRQSRSRLSPRCAVRMALSWPHTTLTTAGGERYIGATILEAVKIGVSPTGPTQGRTIQSDRWGVFWQK